MLYERDYHLGLTETEEQQYEEITGRKFWEKRVSGFGRVNNFMAYPKAARMCKSLFPNNYLDVAELRDVERLEHANEEFLSLLDNTECTERSILNFIREKEYYNIIGSIIWGLSINIGNHGAYLFPEFQLGSSYKADYLLLGKSSGGFEFIFVELESPYGNITLKDGQLGAEFRDGISQLEDWKRWLPANYSSFGEIMRKYKNSAFDLPEEFYVLDMSRFHYVVVAGRRTDFRDKTYIIKRERKKADDIDIIHYDNLFDFSNNLIGNQTYLWARLGCFNYAPTFFGTSLPEVVDIKENQDGTVTLTVEAVSDMVICDDAVITHELTVRFAEDGSFQYLGNEILNDGIMHIPDYQYRIKD